MFPYFFTLIYINEDRANPLSFLISSVSLFNGLLPVLQKFLHNFSEERAVIRTSLVSSQEPEILWVIKRSSHFRPKSVSLILPTVS